MSKISPRKNTRKDPKVPSPAPVGDGVVGSALGWIAGIGAFAIPGLGFFIAAGPVIAAISGAAIGVTLGGIAGGLIGISIPELDAKRYEDMLQDDNILLSVHTDNSEELDRPPCAGVLIFH